MTVAQISTLRRQLRTLDADYKVFKNTLVRRAIEGTSVESLDEFLVGPTAIAFVNGDVSAVAKALRDFAKATPTLVVKGGVLDGKALSLRSSRPWPICPRATSCLRASRDSSPRHSRRWRAS
jgi:large subunit ribosomal protein L10